MKKITLVLATLIFSCASMSAQQQITSGAGYKKQTFYNLTSDATATINNVDWDIAFTVYGQQDAGVFLNESAGGGANPENPIKLYKAPTNVFADVISATTFSDSLFNDELGWSYGAFNNGRDAAKPFDYGWGTYSPATNEVAGGKVFVLKLRNKELRKIEIQKLKANIYTFRHAKLDGTDEKIVTIDKAQFAGKTLAYFSFTSETAKNLEPAAGFDLHYTRYVSTVDQNGVPTPYPVLGVLTGRGIQAVKASGIDPEKVDYKDYLTKFEKKTDVIGYDWKTFLLASMTWAVPTDVAYFVKLKNNDIYKLVFIDFEGSATGTATFEKTLVYKPVIKTNDLNNEINFSVFPTVASSDINFAFDNKNVEKFDLNITDMSGRSVLQNSLDVNAGFQVNTLNISDLASGTYIISLKSAKGIATSKFVKL